MHRRERVLEPQTVVFDLPPHTRRLSTVDVRDLHLAASEEPRTAIFATFSVPICKVNVLHEDDYQCLNQSLFFDRAFHVHALSIVDDIYEEASIRLSEAMRHLSCATTLKFIASTVPPSMLGELHHMASLTSIILLDCMMRSDIIGAVNLSSFKYQISGDAYGRTTLSHHHWYNLRSQQTTFSTLMRITSSALEHIEVPAHLAVFYDLQHMVFPRLKTVILEDFAPWHTHGPSFAKFLCAAPALESVDLRLYDQIREPRLTIWPRELGVHDLMQQKGLRDPPLSNLKSFVTQSISADDDIFRHLPHTLQTLSFSIHVPKVDMSGATLRDVQKYMRTKFTLCRFHDLQTLQLHIIGSFSPSSFRIISTAFPRLSVFRFSNDLRGPEHLSFPFTEWAENLARFTKLQDMRLDLSPYAISETNEALLEEALPQYAAEGCLVCAELIPSLKLVAMTQFPTSGYSSLPEWHKYSIDRSDDQVQLDKITDE